MSTKRRWGLIYTGLYLLFVILMISTHFLDPAQIGLTWTIFWYAMGAGIAYYFYLKTTTFFEVLYYARALQLDQAALKALVPTLKENQTVPDPDWQHAFPTLSSIPFSAMNLILKELTPRAQAAGITPFR